MTVALALVFFFTAVCTGAVDIDCNDGQFYIRADPASCRHFYKCDNGKPVKFTCPDTLYYNPSLHVCDWPQNVKCSVNLVQGAGNSNNGGQTYGGNNGGQQYNNNKYPSNQNSANSAAQNVNNNKYPSNQNSANNAAQNTNNNKYPSNQNSANNAAQNANNNKYPSNQNSANNAAQNVNNNKYPSNQNSANNAGQQYNNNGYSSTNNAVQNFNNNKYPSNQNSANNVGQQHNRPSSTNQVEQPYPDYDNLYDELMYPTPNFNQGYSGTQNTDVGPSVQDPLGEHERPRPTVDQLYSSNSHPYQEYLGSNSIDIRK